MYLHANMQTFMDAKLNVFTVAATHLRLYAGIELLEKERRSQRTLWWQPRVCWQ